MALRSHLILVLALLVALQAPLAPAAVPALPGPDSCAADGDAGESAADAESIGTPAACDGWVSVADPSDRYVFVAAASQRIDVHVLSPEGSAFRVCLVGPDDEFVGCRNGNGAVTLVAGTVVRGAHTLTVMRGSSAAVAYEFTLAVSDTPPQDDCGSGRDAGEDGRRAVDLALPVGCAGLLALDGVDEADWYAFPVSGSGRLVVDTTADVAFHRTVCLYAPGATYSSSCGANATTVSGPAEGTWRLRVSASGPVSYGLTVALQPPPAQDDCGIGGDVGGTPGTALAILAPATCAGMLARDFGDSYDVYAFSAAAGELINITLASAGQKWLCLLDATGAPTGPGCISGPGAIAYVAPAAGDFYASIYSWRIEAPEYTLSVDVFAPSAPWQSDCGEAGDAGNHAGAARSLAASSCDAQLGFPWEDPEDWYVVEAVQGATTRVLLESAGGDADLCVYRADGRTLVGCSSLPESHEDVVSFSAETTGAHLVRVVSFRGEPSYRLSTEGSFTQDDCGSGRDAGAAQGAVRAMQPVCHGALPVQERDFGDAFLVHAEAGQTITAALSSQPFFDYDLCLYAPGAETPAVCSAQRFWNVERLSHTADVAGDWRVAIALRSGGGEYDLAIGVA